VEYNNILIIKMSSLGDIIHALPFAAALRRRFPRARISWLVHPQFSAFVPEAPLIDEVLYFDKAAFKKMSWGEKAAYAKKMRRELHSKKFDLVIDLQGLFKSGALAYLTGCKNKIGYCQMREGSSLISRPITGSHAHDHVIERYLDVARYLGADCSKIEYPLPNLTKEETQVAAMLPDMVKPYIVMAPGARWETKQWPTGHFARLGQMFIRDGYNVVLAGAPGDGPKGTAIETMLKQGAVSQAAADMVGSLFNLIGKTNIRQLGALIKDSIFYVSADTGPLHIAAALGKPLVAVYGPTKPDRTGPYGDKDAVVLTSPIECAGCLKKHCDHWQCMAMVTPEMVYKVFKNKILSHK
jgi:heptosyltransferase-1/heptosyltransferase-2